MSGRRKLGKLPRRPAAVLLGPRDRFVCAAVAKARVMTTSDLALLTFPSVAIARRRLRRLHDGGFLAAYVASYSEENRWTLDIRGRQLLGLSDRHAPARVPVISLHRQFLVRLWVLLATACHAEAEARLKRFSFEWELTGGGLPTERTYRPDAVLQIEVGPLAADYMVEVDTGTEPLRHLAERKLPQVRSLMAAGSAVSGVPAKAVLFTAPSAARLSGLLRVARQTGVPAVGLVMAPTQSELRLAKGWDQASGGSGALVREPNSGGLPPGLPPDRGPRSQVSETTQFSGGTRHSDYAQRKGEQI